MRKLKQFVVFLCLFACLSAHAGQVTGLIQSAGGTPLSNASLTFTPTMFSIVAGSFVQTAASVPCYTDALGNVVGLPNPLVNATAAAANSGSLTAATTYYLQFTYWVGATETAPSPEFAFFLPGGQSSINITAPALQPTGATGYRVYASTTPGGEKLQQTVTGFGNTSITSLLSVTSVTSSNNTVCSFNFSDSLIPQARYVLRITDSSGSDVPGWPQTYYMQGSTFNLNTAFPTANTTAIFQNAIVSTPSGGVTQSIFGGLTLNGFGLTAGSVSASGLVSAYTSAGELIGKYSTISAAQAAAGSSGRIEASCGPLNENILNTTTSLDFSGTSQGQNCSILQPLVPGTDLFKIDATASGTTSGTSFRNFDVNCPSGTCGNIASITGSNSTNQPNDWHNFSRIYSSQFGVNTTGTAGFANGFVVSGREIYSAFQRLRINATRGIGFQVTSSGGLVGPWNANHIRDSQLAGNFSYGFSLDGTGSTTFAEGNTLESSVVENNAQNAALSPCAGALIKGTYIFGFWHDYFEVNCPSSGDANSSNVRITGSTTVPYFVDFFGNDMLTDTAGPKYNIFADSSRSGGVIMGNRFGGNAVPTAAVHIAATSLDSLWEVGVNQGMGKIDAVLDGGSYSHVTAPAFGVVGDHFVLGNSGTSCTGGASFDLVNGCSQGHQINNITLSGPAFAWTNWTNSMPGSWIVAQAFSSNGYTLTNSAGGAGQFVSRDGTNLVLGTAGDAVMFRTDLSGNLQEMFRSYVSMPNTWLKDQSFSGNITQTGAKKITTGSAGLSINSGTALTGQNGTAANTNAVTSPTSSPYVGVASDFTTPADTNFHTITGLSWTFPAVAGNYNFHCAILYQQNVAAASVFLGIQAATNNPTNIAAVGHLSTNANGSAADGTLPTLATTTATAIVNGSPSATATVFLAYLDGRIELGASANTINIATAQSVAADTVTIKRGSSCQLF